MRARMYFWLTVTTQNHEYIQNTSDKSLILNEKKNIEFY